MDILCTFEYNSYKVGSKKLFLVFEQHFGTDASSKHLSTVTTTAERKFQPIEIIDERSKLQCITSMDEYADLSLEELRIGDYAANLKDSGHPAGQQIGEEGSASKSTLSEDEKVFCCKVDGQLIPDGQDLKFIGQHVDGKTSDDVIMVKFDDCTVTKVPQGLTKVFPNMKILWIVSSKLKDIRKNDLIEYKNLKAFRFERNKIEYLPGDLFEDFTCLERIEFFGNDLKVVDRNILDGLDKLKVVDFRDDFLSSMYFSADLKSFLPTLNELKSKHFENYPKIYKLWKESTEKLRQLKDSCRKLEAQLEHEKLESSKKISKIQTRLFSDVTNFIQDDTTKDFKILIEGQEFPVHKFLLAARSPTLAEVLKNNPEVENLKLVDIPVDIFKDILKFLYTDKFPGDDGTNFLHLFAAAGKLKIEELKDFAASNLINQIDENNAMEAFKLSNKYECDELRQKAFKELKNCHLNYKFKDEWIEKPEIVMRAIEQFKKNEEAIRKLEEEFENSTLN